MQKQKARESAPGGYSGYLDSFIMKRNFAACFLAGMFLLSASCGFDNRVTTFILVRHAEKADDGTDDPGLRPQGEGRANRLAYMLKDISFDGIYSTDFKRTRNTVAPIADVESLEVQLYEPGKVEEIQKMFVKHHGGAVLVCGHANNIPWTANLLMGKETYKDYADDEYGVILIISVVEMGKEATVVRVNY